MRKRVSFVIHNGTEKAEKLKKEALKLFGTEENFRYFCRIILKNLMGRGKSNL